MNWTEIIEVLKIQRLLLFGTFYKEDSSNSYMLLVSKIKIVDVTVNTKMPGSPYTCHTF